MSSLCLTGSLNALAAERCFLTKGTPAPYDGYFFDVESGEAIATGWAKAEADAKSWQTAYEDLRREIAESAAQQTFNTEALASQINVERRNHRRKVIRTTVLSVLAGGIIGAVLHNNH